HGTTCKMTGFFGLPSFSHHVIFAFGIRLQERRCDPPIAKNILYYDLSTNLSYPHSESMFNLAATSCGVVAFGILNAMFFTPSDC
ncbi:hypothetical protein U6Q21_12675, partial [Cutibacterium acnes]